jgi:hypothetical protein
MDTTRYLWDRVQHPRGPAARLLHRAGLSALGTYAAYVTYGILHPHLARPTVTPDERGQRLPGDALVPTPSWITDFGIDIAATPAEVWPWLLQIGFGRAGWYTWFPLDNGGVASADRLRPELQSLQVGDVIPDGGRAAEGYGVWRVRELAPARTMVLFSRRNPVDGREIEPGDEAGRSFLACSWVFHLVEPVPGRTRVHVRVRASFHGAAWVRPVARVAKLLFGVGDSVMENSLLEGLRDRVERRAGAQSQPSAR